jgi:hypothetical protein
LFVFLFWKSVFSKTGEKIVALPRNRCSVRIVFFCLFLAGFHSWSSKGIVTSSLKTFSWTRMDTFASPTLGFASRLTTEEQRLVRCFAFIYCDGFCLVLVLFLFCFGFVLVLVLVLFWFCFLFLFSFGFVCLFVCVCFVLFVCLCLTFKSLRHSRVFGS